MFPETSLNSGLTAYDGISLLEITAYVTKIKKKSSKSEFAYKKMIKVNCSVFERI